MEQDTRKTSSHRDAAGWSQDRLLSEKVGKHAHLQGAGLLWITSGIRGFAFELVKNIFVRAWIATETWQLWRSQRSRSSQLW